MAPSVIHQIPDEYADDIRVAVHLLQRLGCTEVYLFGSVVEGNLHADSDIDIAVRGCPSDRFFYAVGRLVMELEHTVDLIDLDRSTAFTDVLQASGNLFRVA